MGTKRHIAAEVRQAVTVLDPQGSVVDLFGGMGSVGEALASDYPVYENDFLRFASVIAKARLTHDPPVDSTRAAEVLRPAFIEHRDFLFSRFERRLARERRALEAGEAELAAWLETAPHVGNSDSYRLKARRAAVSSGPEHFQLVTLHFSAGYFSTTQAIELDAIRAAINSAPAIVKTHGLASWLLTAARLVNSPGHTAQYLRPNSHDTYRRIKRTFDRSAWSVFGESLSQIQPLGTPVWRRTCQVFNAEAIQLLRRFHPGTLGVVYADPPYTKDQYSRFYHVFETMTRYDFPGARGRGRTPYSVRPMSAFSRAREVGIAFVELFEQCSRLRVPVVLSYPADGLLTTRGLSVADVASRWYRLESVCAISREHSTLGASKGAAQVRTNERIFTFLPRRVSDAGSAVARRRAD